MKIHLKCPICGKTGSGDLPEDIGKERGLTDGQTLEMPCPDCLSENVVGAIQGIQAKIEHTPLAGKITLDDQIEAISLYHKNILKKEKSVQPVLFTLKGKDVNIFMLTSVMDDKDKAEVTIKAVLADTKPDAYFMVTEAWQGTNPDIAPSQDPDRKEILLVYGQQKGKPGQMLRSPFIKFDGEVRFNEPDMEFDSKQMEGRFVNLLSTS